MSLRPLLLTLLLLLPVAGRAQEVVCDPGDVEVVSLRFTGNRAFSGGELADGLVTTPSSWVRGALRVVGARRCLDRAQFPLDVVRLLIWYRNHGYVGATVDTVLAPAGEGRVSVRFHVTEGAPVLVDTLRWLGLDAVPERARLLRGLPLREGGPFDKYALAASRDSLVRRLRDGGYPEGDVFTAFETRTAARRATVTFTAVPGPRARLAPVAVEVVPARPGAAPRSRTTTVLTLSRLKAGALYRQSDLELAKRALYAVQSYQGVVVEPLGVSVLRGDTVVGVRLQVTEGPARQARLGGGWGTLDCFRVTGELNNYDVAGSGARLELQARTSKLGIGRPVTGLGSLCPQARDDVFSDQINYYAGATLVPRPLGRWLVQPSLTLFTEQRSEFNAYRRVTPVGLSLQGIVARPRRTHAVTYALEYGGTSAFPALFCAIFNACNDAEQAALSRRQRLAVLGASTAYERVDNPVNPTRGFTWRGDVRQSAPGLGSDRSLQFTRGTLDASAYAAVGDAAVLAARVRIGAVLGPSFDFTAGYVPPQERLYAGGPTTVRGFRQNELGPAVYIPAGYDTVRSDGRPGGNPANLADTVFFRSDPARVGRRMVPAGGNALFVANLEARLRSPVLPRYLQWTAFMDVGQVGNRGAGGSLGLSGLRWTPGLGVRVASLIGFIRVDVGYNPYQRPAGAAYFDAPLAQGGQLLCVSPTNRLRVVQLALPSPQGPFEQVLVQETGGCPADFQPPRPARLLQRLAFNLSIGQAF